MIGSNECYYNQISKQILSDSFINAIFKSDLKFSWLPTISEKQMEAIVNKNYQKIKYLLPQMYYFKYGTNSHQIFDTLCNNL